MTLLIDVRTPEEYATGHIEGAENIPVEDIDTGNLGMLHDREKDSPIQLYCRSGARSGYALTLLQLAGFSNVTNLGSQEDAKKAIL